MLEARWTIDQLRGVRWVGGGGVAIQIHSNSFSASNHPGDRGKAGMADNGGVPFQHVAAVVILGHSPVDILHGCVQGLNVHAFYN